jgi:hypothetical protein
VSSEAHELYKLDFNDLQTEHGWSWIKAYGRSKTANILFSQHLAKILKGKGFLSFTIEGITILSCSKRISFGIYSVQFFTRLLMNVATQYSARNCETVQAV